MHIAWLLNSGPIYWYFLIKYRFSHREFLVKGILLFLPISILNNASNTHCRGRNSAPVFSDVVRNGVCVHEP